VTPKKLLLVHPPQAGLLEGFASGLIALANFVSGEDPGAHVELVDLGLNRADDIEQEIALFLGPSEVPPFIGITTTTATYQGALRVAEVVKRLNRVAVVVLGGHHASAQADVVLSRHDCVDYVIRGEGEIALATLLRLYPDVAEVPNLSYRQGSGIRHNATAPLLAQDQLDRLPATFRGRGLRSAPGKFDHATYVSARGCPLKCAFCAVANERIRSKSVDAVVDDLRVLISELGYRRIAIEDNFFAHSPKRTLELCAALSGLRRELQFSWDCQTRVESMRRPDIVRAMEAAGCEAAYLGIESLHRDQLLYLAKTHSPDAYVRALEEEVLPQLLRSRIDCYMNIQVGLPGEGTTHRESTLGALSRYGQLAVAHGKSILIFPKLHVVYPGTRHFQDALAQGRFGPLGADVFEAFTAWEERQEPVLRWLGAHFAHGTGGIPEGILARDQLRQGCFQVDADAVLSIVSYLEAIEAIEGISVFRYGRYLAPSTASKELCGTK